MRTYTHGILGWLLYIRGSAYQKKLAAIGAMLPDAFLAIGFIFHVTPTTAVTGFLHTAFHHSWLHNVTLAMHSYSILLPLLCITYYVRKQYLPLLVGMVSHAFIDMLTHQLSGYNHFYPLIVPEFSGVVFRILPPSLPL